MRSVGVGSGLWRVANWRGLRGTTLPRLMVHWANAAINSSLSHASVPPIAWLVPQRLRQLDGYIRPQYSRPTNDIVSPLTAPFVLFVCLLMQPPMRLRSNAECSASQQTNYQLLLACRLKFTKKNEKTRKLFSPLWCLRNNSSVTA